MPAPDSDASAITQCPILHRDRFIIGINKPAGILSHPNAGRSGGKERSAFEGRYDLDEKVFDGPGGRVWLIHRLDQDTSGVLLGALDEKTAVRCREAFEANAVHKKYLALVRGSLSAGGTWLDHLGVSRERGRVRTAVLKGRPPNAELRFKVIGHNAAARLSLLDIDLITGRTHQIRVQAASRQHPLAGDDVYGDFHLNRRLRAEIHLRRLFLHARQLELKHPASGQKLVIEAPLADDLQGAVTKLGFKL
ncbi:MAG TPA: RluA family pseudouridine synthase [Prosthecobacter sp.]|nr:RluA family pseudouridine synthase [Prosthecobacter sp.]